MGSGLGVKPETLETDRSFLSGTEFKIYRSVLHGVNIDTKYQYCEEWLIS